MKILIIGGAGFIGSAVIRHILEHTNVSGIHKTVQWYLNNQQWWSRILDDTYQGQRLGLMQ